MMTAKTIAAIISGTALLMLTYLNIQGFNVEDITWILWGIVFMISICD
jgi:hypothetical protein